MQHYVSLLRPKGFSLVELAIVLLVLSVLAAGAISMFRVQGEQAKINRTNTAQDEAKEALFAYAEANFGLPCPDTTEPPDGIIDVPCPTGARRGYLPWKDLGLSSGSDGWGQPMLYVVTANLVAGVLKDRTLKTAAGDIAVIEEDAGALVYAVTPEAVAFAVWSVGPDGNNASAPQGTGSAKVITGSSASPQDDMVSWGSRYALIGRVLHAGNVIPLE